MAKKVSKWQRHQKKYSGKGFSRAELQRMFRNNQWNAGFGKVELDLATNDCERRIEVYLKRKRMAVIMINGGATKTQCPHCNRTTLMHQAQGRAICLFCEKIFGEVTQTRSFPVTFEGGGNGTTRYKGVTINWDEDFDTLIFEFVDDLDRWERLHLVSAHESEATLELKWDFADNAEIPVGLRVCESVDVAGDSWYIGISQPACPGNENVEE